MKTKTQEFLEKVIEQMKKDFEETEENLPKEMKLSKAELFETMGKLEQHKTDIENFKKLISKLKVYPTEITEGEAIYGAVKMINKEEIKEALKEL